MIQGGRNKMAGILSIIYYSSIVSWQTFVSVVPIGNKSALVSVMDWCRTGDKQFPEVLMTKFTDTNMH